MNLSAFDGVFPPAGWISVDEPGPIKGIFGSGRLALGWVFKSMSDRIKKMEDAWPFASFAEGVPGLRVAFPSSLEELKALEKVLQKHGVQLPDSARALALKVIENAILRGKLSTAKALVEGDAMTLPVAFRGEAREYQELALRYARSLGYRALVGDDMGVGKTPTSIMIALDGGFSHNVIFCRPSATDNWMRRCLEFCDCNVHIAYGVKPMAKKNKSGYYQSIPALHRPWGVSLNSPLPTAEKDKPTFVVVSYAVAHAWEETLKTWLAEGGAKQSHLIIDEGHAIKHDTARHSKTIYKLMAGGVASGVSILSGTICENRTEELFNILDKLHPGRWGKWWNFAQRYCDAKMVKAGVKLTETGEKMACGCGGRNKECPSCSGSGSRPKMKSEPRMVWDTSGASNLQGLFTRLRNTGMVRRLKQDVLNQLPIQQDTYRLPKTKAYELAEEGLLPEILRMHRDEIGKEPSENDNSISLLLQAAAVEKIEWMKEFAVEFMEDSSVKKMVIFFHHNVIGKELVKWCKEAGFGYTELFGANPELGGDYRFRTDQGCHFALCSYGSARESIELQAAYMEVLLEFSYVPSWMEQARDRVNRSGQTNGVQLVYPYLEGSVEEDLIDAFMGKQDTCNLILDGRLLRRLNVDKKYVKTGLPARKKKEAEEEIMDIQLSEMTL